VQEQGVENGEHQGGHYGKHATPRLQNWPMILLLNTSNSKGKMVKEAEW
jgi:hypothetical protein